MRQFVVCSRVCVSFVLVLSFCYFWWVFPIKLTDPPPPPPSCRHGPRRLPSSSHHITACFVRSRCIFAGKSLVISAKSYLLHGTSEPTTTTKILRNSLHVSNKYRSNTHTHTLTYDRSYGKRQCNSTDVWVRSNWATHFIVYSFTYTLTLY